MRIVEKKTSHEKDYLVKSDNITEEIYIDFLIKEGYTKDIEKNERGHLVCFYGGMKEDSKPTVHLYNLYDNRYETHVTLSSVNLGDYAYFERFYDHFDVKFIEKTERQEKNITPVVMQIEEKPSLFKRLTGRK